MNCPTCHGEGFVERELSDEVMGTYTVTLSCECTRCSACDHVFAPGEERVPDSDWLGLNLCRTCADAVMP